MDTIIAMMLGVVASFLQGYNGKTKYANWVRYLIAVGTSFLAGLVPVMVEMYASGQTPSAENIMASIGAAFIAGQTAYNIYLKQVAPPPRKKN